ncbi:mitotic interactor and substrate of PLK1 [Meles meles]|uniref:mitotic interactor and substrate of PLK1 n=1 Tax=Meles meles TaxID=9662 RepID=UPI001E69EE0E|nr:mitotic interactor and substrate of PLK1 [Meles meles]XP_045848050.1 mitotic interactor and substrate of PLK1 [Meles meles]XP_045848051.1 mitotic interactor and substrate of PLK1 [Meles meles]
MDRVTRYPIFSIARSPRLAGLDPSGDTSYTFEVVDVGPEASGWGQDKPQAWPAHQEARLNATRTGAFSSPRAFAGQSSPWTLWREGDKDEEAKACHLDTRDAQPQRPGDLEQERWVVIQSQALRKSSTVATLHGTPGLPDPSSTQPQTGPLEESAVDREQIDFLAARQQFLSLEQASAGAPLHPAARVAPARAAPGVDQAPRAPGGPLPVEREVLPPEKRVGGLPAASPVRAAHDAASPAQAGSRRLPKETPIEREIRLAQEREADLREQRGLRRASSQQELVEIPARPLLLTTVSPAAAPRRERGRPSLYVQRDLAQGTRREEDHRRRQEPEATQSGLRRAFSSDSILDLASAGGAADPGPQVRKVNRIPADAYQPFLRAGGRAVPAGPAGPAVQARAQPRGLSADEAGAAGPPRRPLEAPGTPPGRQRECPRPPPGRGRAHGAVVRREYFHLSPLRFRVPDVPPRAEGPGGGGWEAGGTPARGRPRPPSSELLEREVESVLQREREAAEERRTALFPEVFSPPPAHGDDQDSRSSSAASGVAGSYSVSRTHFFSPVHLHSGLVWRAEAPADPAPEQRRRKEQQYASISASDHIDWEVLEATRVTHHKSAMARRWEAGIYASEGQD